MIVLRALHVALHSVLFWFVSADHYVGHGQKYTTLEAARDAMRLQPPEDSALPVNVYLAPGRHILTQTFTLDSRDDAPVIYRSLDPTQRAKLHGGLQIPVEEFKSSGGSSSVVMEMNLFDYGARVGTNITTASFGNGKFGDGGNRMELFVNGEPMHLAQDPNRDGDVRVFAGFENASNVTVSAAETSIDFQDAERGTLWREALKPGSDDTSTSSSGRLHLHGYWAFDWAQNFVTVKDIAETSSGHHKITLDTVNGEAPSFGLAKNCRFYAVNALALLDQEREYFINTTSGDLFFIPPRELLRPEDVITVSLSEVALISVSNSRSPQQWRDMEIAVSRGSLAVFSNVSNLTIGPNMHFSNSYGDCVQISSNGGEDASGDEIVGQNINVINSVFENCGGSSLSATASVWPR